MAKTPKSTQGQEITILEVYPEDIAAVLMPGDLELLKEKYGDRPCSYEVCYPWKKHAIHHTWFVDDIYKKFGKTHKIVQQKTLGAKNPLETT